jgi:hypothetical protein
MAGLQRERPAGSFLAAETKVMDVRRFVATRRHDSAVVAALLVVAFVAVEWQNIARAQFGRPANQRPAQGYGSANSLNPYGMPHIGGANSPYPVKDPTADERASVAGRVYRAILDEWNQSARTTLRPGQAKPDADTRSILELTERLGVWSLRWQDAQDNAAKSRAARYQALSDHLARMAALEHGGNLRETGHATAGHDALKPPRGSAEVARFFRPIDQWDIVRIIPTLLVVERPLNPLGVRVTPAEQYEIADRIYHLILDEAVDRFLASSSGGRTHANEVAIFDNLLAEQLGLWSDLWRQSQEAAARDPFWRTPAVGDRSARVAPAGVRAAGPVGYTAAMRSHIERMRELETGRLWDVALKRLGRSGSQSVDMTITREFGDVIRFFRIDAESRLSDASRPNDVDVTHSGQAATAEQIYRAILDKAANQCHEAPRAGAAHADFRLIFDARLAERLAAWSMRWARAEIRADMNRVTQFNAIRSHLERITSLEDGRTCRDALARVAHGADAVAAPTVPSEFADVARFFRLEAMWELAIAKSR